MKVAPLERAEMASGPPMHAALGDLAEHGFFTVEVSMTEAKARFRVSLCGRAA